MMRRRLVSRALPGYPADVDIIAPSTLIQFARTFPTDDACLEFLARMRWPNGFVCPACGSTRASFLKKRRLWECFPNKHQTSVTAGTVLHGTRTSLTTWFYAAYLMSTLTPGISALQLQKQLGIGRYETAFQMLHKLRSALVAPGREQLGGVVEVDECFIGGPEEGRPGRGAETKVLVVVGVEIVEWTAPDPRFPDNPDVGIGKHRAGRVRMNIIPDASGKTLIPWVSEKIAKGSTVMTDGWKGYSGLAAAGYQRKIVFQRRMGQPTGEFLPMVHLIISNLKRWLTGTYKGGWQPKHLQAYLNEFTFRFNRRFWRGPAFARALGLATHPVKRATYASLYAAGDEGGWVHPARGNPLVLPRLRGGL
jgi:transposase-like protein